MSPAIVWSDLTRDQRSRILSREPLALACTLQGGRRWRQVNGVLVGGSLTPLTDHGVFVPNILHVAVRHPGVTRTGRAWSMETHDPDSPMLNLIFDMTHEGTAAYLAFVLGGL